MPDLHDLREFAALARVNGLQLSPDGTWLAAPVQTLSGDGKKYVTSIWRISTDQGRPAVRLTRSAEGEAGPVFLPDGSLLFISKRPEPTAKADDEAGGDEPALWLLPSGGRGGEQDHRAAGRRGGRGCRAGRLVSSHRRPGLSRNGGCRRGRQAPQGAQGCRGERHPARIRAAQVLGS